VGLDVSVSYPAPGIPIPLATVVWTFVLVIASVHHPGVFLAVTVVGKEGAAGETTGLLWFGWHVGIPPLHKKSPCEMGSHIGLVSIYFSIISIPHKG